ncbi:uncharacterized protein PHALS_10462 [Plasmopara halstedii]|uniref:Uncharacterized protein n=1 Tax=Plasmopara halstedii TaxID=4781 RepID=A0A0P1AGK0_PLAHL|nr:uncharacterized protein PHALS_10462 [Plasmopara halstedii]CEG40250.1 hypothetical protein PHALS_10462 [Plasmopara halstedii]|eukprot:XP_024576619.1 hypothetical protein PHALS_10462 [Plasmopara halstedii]
MASIKVYCAQSQFLSVRTKTIYADNARKLGSPEMECQNFTPCVTFSMLVKDRASSNAELLSVLIGLYGSRIPRVR